ncbi:hypothetical protein LJ737_20830 [Hymenobacter sp. 15J16-1T3B]|uniref:hypothetical protein n=1 Tax=Hymenobacter sp. 15J16-1T3B TaxID=2886941 RepID=UPI001D12752D|nr:hypothetical protein [Hymenobacter sp. 15J16-1T3B]MCC3159699.1 hypothetical protein [Hymenobacter sp. 15J16-1T3B]
MSQTRPYRKLDGITKTKGGHKVKELYYIAATTTNPAPGIIGLMWRDHAYRDTIWTDEGKPRYEQWPDEYALDLSAAPVEEHQFQDL